MRCVSLGRLKAIGAIVVRCCGSGTFSRASCCDRTKNGPNLSPTLSVGARTSDQFMDEPLNGWEQRRNPRAATTWPKLFAPACWAKLT
jgi:hypothetical protein